MKSRPLGTKLRLFKIFRWLGLVVALKLAIMIALLFDLPGAMLQGGSSLTASYDPAGDSGNTIMQATTYGVVSQAQAAGIIGGDSSNATVPAETKCPDSIDPALRETLERKQSELDQREQQLNDLENQVNDKLEELQALEGRIKMMLKDAQDLQDEKLRHLVDVYTNMKAKQAAQVLETLDERTAVRILAGMRGRQAGEILQNVNPEKAARLSEMLTRMQLPFN